MGTEAIVNKDKRRFLIGATRVVGGVGAVAAAVPFVMSFWPSERAKAAGAPIEVDISKIEPGQKINVEWRGKVVLAHQPHAGNARRRCPSSTTGSPTRSPTSRSSPRTARTSTRSIKAVAAGSPSASARTSAARRRSGPESRRPTSGRIGSAASSARATSRSSIWRAASTRACRRRPTSSMPPHKYLSRHARRHRRRRRSARDGEHTEGRMSKLLTWIDERFPLTALWEAQWGKYVAPKNFNFWYYFGSLAAFVLVMQIVTGIFLTMNYKPDAAKAFESVEYIMRDVRVGMAHPLHALDRRVDVLHRRLPAHVPRPHVRQLPQAARAHVDLRLPDLSRADGRGVLRLPAAVGPDVVLGRAGDRQPVLGRCRSSARISACGSAATTRSRTSRSTASSRST